MRLISIFVLSLTVLLGPIAIAPVHAATPQEVAAGVRTNWAKAREAYLASVQPYQGNRANATLITQYTAALDKAGASLNNYLNLKLAGSPPDRITPAVDQLYKDLLTLKAIRNKAPGGLGSALNNALTQQNQVTQSALSNMR